jgi:hypothetical protein
VQHLRFPPIDMAGRGRKPAVLKTSSWSNKHLLKHDDSLQTFAWPYNTGALIEELEHISEIADLHEKVQEPTELGGCFSVPMHFQDAFIDSHEFMVDLLDRVTMSWNNSAQEQIVILHQGKNSENEVVSYKTANVIFKRTRERLLRMRSLYEKLKPETQDLVQRCGSFLQIENSMLAQKKAPAQQSEHSMPFQPACGFRLEPKLLTTATLHDRINDVDLQMTRLQMEKDLLLQKLNDEQMLDDAMDNSDKLRTILSNGKSITQTMDAVDYAHAFLVPFKHVLERHPLLFEHTLYAFPDPFPQTFPSTCTADDVVSFYHDMLLALDKDKEHITLLRSKIYYL